MKIYVVSEADYEGRYVPIKAYFNKQDADEFVERKNNYNQRMKERYDELESHFSDCDLSDYEGNGCDICKEYVEFDYIETMTHYTVDEVECE